MKHANGLVLAGFAALLASAGQAQEAKFVYGCQPRASWCSDLACTFDGDASTTDEGEIAGYRWYLRRYLREDRESEYATRTGVRVTHTYTNVRCRSYTYFVTLEVTDTLGRKATHTEQVDPSRRLEFPKDNQPPVADFGVECQGVECRFDASASHDPDGEIASYSWDLGDGGTGSGVELIHGYEHPGSYTVRLTVADDEGVTASRVRTISVVAPGFNLTATGRKALGLQKADLRWTGAQTDSVDIYRDGLFVGSTPNDGIHTDAIDLRGDGSYRYRLCERDLSVCSNEATVVFDD